MLSAGLVFMTDRAGAVPKDKSGVNPTQNSWDDNLPSASGFTVLSTFGGAAVRDNNTGLVWEKAPDATDAGILSWAQATGTCVNKTVGGMVGWRLPSVVELISVRDPSLPPPFVPASIFTGVQFSFYWSATTRADDPTAAWNVLFNNGDVNNSNKNIGLHTWCVRGGMNADAY